MTCEESVPEKAKELVTVLICDNAVDTCKCKFEGNNNLIKAINGPGLLNK